MQGMTRLVIFVITGLAFTDATRTLFGSGRMSAAGYKKKHHHHNKHFFEMLIKDFQDHPKDPKKFDAKCSEIVTALLPELREEYTEKQLPTVLRDSCEVMRHKEDFRKDEDGNKVTEPVLNRAQVQCKYFATELTKEFDGKKNYGGWCKRVFKYLTDVSIPREEVARRIKERNIARSNLEKAKQEWGEFRDAKGKAWARRNKFKRHLSDWKEDGAFGVGVSKAKATDAAVEDEDEEEDADAKASESDEDPPGVDGEDDDDDSNATMVDDQKWRMCCPKGCKVCSGFSLQKGIVRAVNFNGGAAAVKMLKTEASEEAEEMAEDTEADSNEDSDSDEDSDEDEEDAEDAEEDEEDDEEDDDEEEAEEDDDEADADDEDEDVFKAISKTSLLQRRDHPKPKAKKTLGRIIAKGLDAKKTSKHVKRISKPAKVSLPAKSNSTADNEPVHLSGGWFYLLTKEFKRLPKTDEFLNRCQKVISKLMPDLHEEYTWKQVPFVLKHDCEVYATKTDFKTKRMELHHAEKSCKFFAKRLANRFKGDKDYKEWCSNVYAHLLRESDGKGLTDKQKQLLKTHKNFGKEIYQLDDECCPANCRMC